MVEASNRVREKLKMDFGWRFHLGDGVDVNRDFEFGDSRHGYGGNFSKTGEALGAMNPNFDDSNWRKIDLPHDWVVELDFNSTADCDHGFKPVGRKWPSTTIGWYRKTFDIPRTDESKRLSIEFDGIFRDSIIWLNGHYLGRHMSGYTSFQYDITDYVNYEDENVLAIRVDASHFEGWFYEGAGIYRHVWLVKTHPLHISHWGTFISSTVQKVEGGFSAKVTIKTSIDNEYETDSACILISTIFDAEGRQVTKSQSKKTTINAGENHEIVQYIIVKKPFFWSVDSPYIYRLSQVLKQGNTLVDSLETSFGIRTFHFYPEKGFFLNGKLLKLKGVCCHQDHAGVGSALPDRIQDFRIKKLKEIGCNAYRCAHHPPTPELLDACDRLGMLVIDENRMMGSSPEILSQLQSMILRDRNHSSIFLWCLGNEEMAIQGNATGARILSTMKRIVKGLDTTRFVTTAMNGSWGSAFSLINDVQGCNYLRCGNADKFHLEHPEHPMIATETGCTLCTRGIYTNDEKKGYVNAYGTTLPDWGSTAEDMWQYWVSRPFVAGVFVWTGFDYRGEPEAFSWPCINSHYGIMDTCGFPKDIYYYYKSWWSKETVLHIFPHWNWTGREGEEIDVWCYSNCDFVELLLNDETLGKKRILQNSHIEWKVNYVPGKLEAIGYKDDVEVAKTKVETTGPPSSIFLSTNRLRIKADNEDVSMVTVSVVDSRGRVVPTANNLVKFRVYGNGKILGVGNGDPSSHEPDKSLSRRAFNGLCAVIIQSTWNTGEIELTAESEGLNFATININSENCILKPFVPLSTHI
jgi:beta-galactosidase